MRSPCAWHWARDAGGFSSNCFPKASSWRWRDAPAAWLIGYGGLQGLLALVPATVPLPRMESIHLDSSVFLFALGISLATAILFGLVPAIQVSRPQLQSALQRGSQRTGVGGSRVFRRAFVVAEIALALLLLVGAGLLMRSFARLTSVAPGFSARTPAHPGDVHLARQIRRQGETLTISARGGRYRAQRSRRRSRWLDPYAAPDRHGIGLRISPLAWPTSRCIIAERGFSGH